MHWVDSALTYYVCGTYYVLYMQHDGATRSEPQLTKKKFGIFQQS